MTCNGPSEDGMDPIGLWSDLRRGSIGAVVDSGPSWVLRVVQAGEQVIDAIVTPWGGAGGFAPPGAAGAGAYVSWGGFTQPGRAFIIGGRASREVERLVVTLDDGSLLGIRPVGLDLGLPWVFFAAELPLGRRPVAIDVLDAAGSVLERIDVSAPLEV
ncbi:hypothetical protein HRbin12_00785 [bacterium HR12]|nr:hypothetical protein HRbin12_00785 [bacterium HR12]